MSPNQPPLDFDDADVILAFPEYHVQVPLLGRGTFKVAYLADTPNGERVIKILTDSIEADPDDESAPVEALPERLARELEGMALVDSPHVVKILSTPQVTQIGSGRYIVYEEPFYGGGTLQEKLAFGPLPPSEAEALVRALLMAVQDLWDQQGIVHRDIKPGNIVFSEDGRPILLDLGIALYTALSGLTDSLAQSPRTTIYAAPEQFEVRRFAKIDFRTDLFQVGIVGYQAVSGTHPFLAPGVTSVDAYIESLFNENPVDVSGLNCSDELKAVLGRLLAHRPNRRFRSIAEPLKILGQV
jgi:serine/threonine protein kinase